MKNRTEYRFILLLIIIVTIGFTGNKVDNLADFLLGIAAAIAALATVLLMNELLPAAERIYFITGAKLRRLREKA